MNTYTYNIAKTKWFVAGFERVQKMDESKKP
jgi:hypothetical protein